MRAQDLIIEFINLVFYITLISLCIVVVIHINNLETIAQLMDAMVPIAFFIIFYLIKSKLDRSELKSRTRAGNLDIVLRLSFTHKIIFDIILFLTPIIILLIPLLTGTANSIDLLQALIVFLIFYFWHKYLFSKDSL
jgi:hypothetical protein